MMISSSLTSKPDLQEFESIPDKTIPSALLDLKSIFKKRKINSRESDEEAFFCLQTMIEIAESNES
jgi:hypothetical protein